MRISQNLRQSCDSWRRFNWHNWRSVVIGFFGTFGSVMVALFTIGGWAASLSVIFMFGAYLFGFTSFWKAF